MNGMEGLINQRGVTSIFYLQNKFVRNSRSRTMHPQSPASTIDGTLLKECDDLVILGVTFDSTLTFEKNLRSVSRAASQRLGILRKCRVFHERLLLLRYFRGFVLFVLEYCSAVRYLAVDTHLKLLDRTVSGKKVKSSMARSLPVENLLPQNVGSIINYLQ